MEVNAGRGIACGGGRESLSTRWNVNVDWTRRVEGVCVDEPATMALLFLRLSKGELSPRLAVAADARFIEVLGLDTDRLIRAE